jgi:transposase-like protein
MARSVPTTIGPANEPELEQGPDATESSISLPKSKPKFKSAPLGLYAAHGHVWAEVVPDLDAEEVWRMLRQRKGHAPIASPGLRRYNAVTYRGRFYRLEGSPAGRVSARFGQIESFWAYLQRHLKAKGGIRRQRLGLYLAEYSWRYNHSKLSPADQRRALMELIR